MQNSYGKPCHSCPCWTQPHSKTSLKWWVVNTYPPSAIRRCAFASWPQRAGYSAPKRHLAAGVQRGSGRRMVMQIPKKTCGVGVFSLRIFFTLSTYNGLAKKERCVTLCPKTFITKIASFFSAHEKLMCFGKECFVKAWKTPLVHTFHTDVEISYVNILYINILYMKYTAHKTHISFCEYWELPLSSWYAWSKLLWFRCWTSGN